MAKRRRVTTAGDPQVRPLGEWQRLEKFAGERHFQPKSAFFERLVTEDPRTEGTGRSSLGVEVLRMGFEGAGSMDLDTRV